MEQYVTQNASNVHLLLYRSGLPYDDYERHGQEYAHRRAVYHRRDEYYTSPRGTEPSVRSVINRATMITVERRREPYANDYHDRMYSEL